MLRIAKKLALALAIGMVAHSAHSQTPMTPGQAAADARTLGSSKNPTTAADITDANRVAKMPAAPPPRDCMPASSTVEGYFAGGNGNLSTNSTALMSTAPVGTSPECQAINYMQGRSSTANPISINPADPLVLGSKATLGNPAGNLGPTAGLFGPKATSSCLPGTVTTGGTPLTETCYDYAALSDGTCDKPWNLQVQPWWGYKCEKTPYVLAEQTCTKEEVPTVVWAPNCIAGAQIAMVDINTAGNSGPSSDRMQVKAYCDLSGTGLTFRVHAFGGNGSCIGEQQVSTTRDVTSQTILTDLAPHWGGYCQYGKVAVNAGSKCTNGTCNFSFNFGYPNYVCEAGRAQGHLITLDDGNGNFFPVGTDDQCFVVNPPGTITDGEGNVTLSCQVPGGILAGLGGNYVCAQTGSPVAATITGVGGYTIPISFTEPKNVAIVTENTISTCGALESNGQCTPIGSTCLDGVNETRSINGYNITKACWKTEFKYSCKSGAGPDFCQPLANEPTCAQVGLAGCSVVGPDGTCQTFYADYKCTTNMGPPPNISLMRTGYDIIQDSLDVSACNAYASNANCTRTASECIDTADRNFFGFVFSRSCWKYTDTYSCAAGGQSNCQPLIDAGCTNIPTATTCTSYLPDGTCGTTQKVYQCGGGTTTVTTGSTCDSTPYCINGICYDTSRPGDPDFGKTVAGMEIARQIGTYIDPATHEIFKGVSGHCRRKLFGANNCCKNPGGGSDWTNAAYYAATSYARYYMGSTYTFDGLFNGDGVNWMGLAMQAGGMLISGATTASIYGVTLSFSGGSIAIVGFDPTTMAIAIAVQLILTELTSCPSSDQNTAMKKAQGICHYVGSYCSSKFLGACYTSKEAYCCFNSKLAKAINIGGKSQLGKSLGSPQAPDCSGLTITQVQSLDFSTIDLSEFIASITPDALTDSQAKTAVTNRLTSYAPVPPSYGNVTPPVQGTPGPAPSTPIPPTTLTEPTMSVVWNPSPGVSGQTVTLSTVTTNATSLSYDCTGAWATSGTVPVGVANTVLSIPAGLLGTADCLFTATNPQFDIVRQFNINVGPSAPLITASFSPSSVGVGQPYQFTVNSNNADSVTYTCNGRTESGTLPVGAYTSPTALAKLSELGTVTCTFTAKNSLTGVVANATATQQVVKVVPVVNVSAPAYVVQGSTASITVNTIYATTLTYSCTGPLTLSGTLAVPTGVLSGTLSPTAFGTLVCQFSATSESNDTTKVSSSTAIGP